MTATRRTCLLLLSTALLLTALPLFAGGQKGQPSADMLFESARKTELVDGKLQEAIKLYQQVVKEHGGDRALAAKALLGMGRCYERLGQIEARSSYERILHDFGDQQDLVAEARFRLSALSERAATTRPQMTVRQVWARAADTTGAPSSDGRLLSGTDWQTGDVAVFDVATQESKRITRTGDVMKSGDHALFAAFSPDDTLITYAWFDSKINVYELRVVNADGSGVRTLLHIDRAMVLPLGWSADSKQVAAIVDARDTPPGKQIVLVAVADGRTRVLKSSGSLADDLSVSPDGRYVAYDPRQANGRRDIHLIRVQDGVETRLVAHPSDDGSPVWTPDGRRLLFVSDRTGTPGLWMVEVENGKAVAAPELVRPDIGPGFIAMGFTKKGSLFYGLSTGMTDIYLGAIDLAALRFADTPSAINQVGIGANRLPAWSPDGTRLAYASKRGPATSPGASITVRAIASGEERDYAITATTTRRIGWFPDGGAILVTGLDEQRKAAIFKLDLKTGAFTTVVPVAEGIAVLPAQVTPDGRTLLYLAADVIASSRTIIARDLSTGEQKTLAGPSLGAIGSFGLSHDARHLAVVSTDPVKRSSIVWVMPSSGGEPREVCRFDKPNAIAMAADLAWSPDSREILLVARLADKPELVAIAVEGGTMRHVPLPIEGVSGFSLHPDGRRIACAAGQSQSDVWVIENFLPPVTKKPPTVPGPR